MKMPCKLLAAAALAVGAGSFGAPTSAAPITAPMSLQNAAAPQVEAVQWRRGWRGWAPGVVAGAIVGGAIAATQPWNYGYYGGPYDAYAYDPGYGYAPGYSYGPVNSYGPGAAYAYAPGPSYSAAPGPSYSVGGDESYCRKRFRSYDPASGTYLGYDGLRHSCP